MKHRNIPLPDWIKAIDAGAAFCILLYTVLPTITLLNAVPAPTGRSMVLMILLFGVGIPVAIFGLWLELKSIARRARGFKD